MTDLDHRTLSIPLFVLGVVLATAGAIGLVAEGATDLATNDPAGALATGGILLFGAFAVTALLNPGSTVGVARARTIPAVGALALVLLLAGVAGGAALGGTVEAGNASAAGQAAAQATARAGLLGEEEYQGSVGGVVTPFGGLGGASSVTHDLDVASGARALHVVLTWTAGTTGASELAMRVETMDGEVLAEAAGASELMLDIEELPEGALRLVVALPEGGASSGQEYGARAAYYDGASSLPSG